MSRLWKHHGRELLRVLAAGSLLLSAGLLEQTGLAQSPSAQTAAAKPLQENRWLFVAETTAAMQGRAEAGGQVVSSLLVSGMDGQMRRGDTVGLWTFNEVPYTGQYPLQRWTPETAKNIARQALGFLKSQPYEKGSRLDFVLSDLQTVIQNSEFITVILISEGREMMRGTPFDDKINTIYRTWKKEQDKAQLPFVTVLRAQRGQIRYYSVTMPPWPLDLPPLPAELAPAKVVEAKPIPPPPPTGQSLIVRGTNVVTAAFAQPSEPVISNGPPAAALVTNAATTAQPAPAPMPTLPAQPAATPVVPVQTTRTESVEPPKPEETQKAEAPLAVPTPPVPAASVALANTSAPVTTTTAPPAAFPARPQVEPPARPATAAAPIQTAMTVPPERGLTGNHNWILVLGIMALVLAGVALGIVLLLVRRMRAPLRVSLIDRSKDQEKKN